MGRESKQVAIGTPVMNTPFVPHDTQVIIYGHSFLLCAIKVYSQLLIKTLHLTCP